MSALHFYYIYIYIYFLTPRSKVHLICFQPSLISSYLSLGFFQFLKQLLLLQVFFFFCLFLLPFKFPFDPPSSAPCTSSEVSRASCSTTCWPTRPRPARRFPPRLCAPLPGRHCAATGSTAGAPPGSQNHLSTFSVRLFVRCDQVRPSNPPPPFFSLFLLMSKYLDCHTQAALPRDFFFPENDNYSEGSGL